MSEIEDSTHAAVEAFRHGFTPIAIRAGDKRPFASAWPQTVWTNEDQVRSTFTNWAKDGVTNVGLLLGDRGGRLVDVDLDHPLALRLARAVLPKTAMMSGRRGRPRSHYWYIVEGETGTDPMPDYRKYKLPDVLEPKPSEKSQRVAVELRSTGSQQTVIPPSVHTTGESYEWAGEPWGGDKGPARVDGKYLARQVALLGMTAVLLERWPKSGERHEAYLALAGGFLRYGEGVHPYWEKNLPDVIRVIAHETRDEDGAETRVGEVMGSTLTMLRKRAAGDSDALVTGFGKLAEIIGNEHADLVKRRKGDIELLSDFKPEPIRRDPTFVPDEGPDPDGVISALRPDNWNPMEHRTSSWDRVDMEPYILNQVVMPDPTILMRSDGKGLMYPGRVNSLYGVSESGKSWVSLVACRQEMTAGGRVMFIDFEDSPEGTWDRLRRIGVGADDMPQFAYVHPEDPLATMMRGRFSAGPDEGHRERAKRFDNLLEAFDPSLIVVDGMTTLYNSHGLDTNAAADTDVIASWLKSLARNGRTTVIVIDHTGKGGEAGSSPIGAHHKVAMVQGTALQVDVVKQPMPNVLGRVKLLVYKDRPGAVRVVSSSPVAGSRVQTAAIVEIDSTVPGMTRISIEPPPPGVDISEDALSRAAARAERDQREDARRQQVRMMREHLLMRVYAGEIGKKLTKEQQRAVLSDAGIEYDSDILDSAVGGMVVDGWLVMEGLSRGTTYRFAEGAGLTR